MDGHGVSLAVFKNHGGYGYVRLETHIPEISELSGTLPLSAYSEKVFAGGVEFFDTLFVPVQNIYKTFLIRRRMDVILEHGVFIPSPLPMVSSSLKTSFFRFPFFGTGLSGLMII